MTTAVTSPATSDGSTRERRVLIPLVIVAAIVATVLWRVVDHCSDPPHVLGARLGGFSLVADPVPLESSTTQIGIMAPYRGRRIPRR